jgi:hypothetical protein
MAKNDVVGVAVDKGSSGMGALKYIVKNQESLKESGVDMALFLLEQASMNVLFACDACMYGHKQCS